jgi:hypothetical protein
MSEKRSIGVIVIGILGVIYSLFQWCWVYGVIVWSPLWLKQNLLVSIRGWVLSVGVIIGGIGFLIGGIGVLYRLNWARKLVIATALVNFVAWLSVLCFETSDLLTMQRPWSYDSDVFPLLLDLLCLFSSFACIHYLTRSKVKEQFK